MSLFIFELVDIWMGVVLFGSILINYGFGHFLGKNLNEKPKKRLFIASVIFNVLYLLVFKYFDFFNDGIVNLLALIGLNVSSLILSLIIPIGISFYTLQLISYNAEIYKKDMESVDLLTLSVYAAYFPKLVAGPIEKPSQLIPQIQKEKSFKKEFVSGGVQLVFLGLFKKIVVADYVAYFINSFYSDPTSSSSTEALLVVFLYAVQLYADFSAYTNIARGTSKFFGIDLTINFNQPYFSTNIQKFWRRWHISLSDWLRDYIYRPLGGSREGLGITVINLLVTIIMCGLWHGIAAHYVIWGVLNGICLGLHRIYRKLLQKIDEDVAKRYKIGIKIYKILSWFVTFQLICIMWVFFRTSNIYNAVFIIRNAYSLNYDFVQMLTSRFFLLLIFSGTIILLIDLAQYKLKTHEIFSKMHWPVVSICVIMIVTALLLFQITEYEPFIYRGF